MNEKTWENRSKPRADSFKVKRSRINELLLVHTSFIYFFCTFVIVLSRHDIFIIIVYQVDGS